MTLLSPTNVSGWDVYINNDFYGSDVQTIQITTNDELRIEITKQDNIKEASLLFLNKLI
jgi:hypothetical protein